MSYLFIYLCNYYTLFQFCETVILRMKSVMELGREKENAWNADTWFEDV